MNTDDISRAPWALLDGFPLLLNLLCWLLLVSTIVIMWRRLAAANAALDSSSEDARRESPHARQNRAYKRAGALLLVVGAIGGFGPSLSLLVSTGKVWSVNRVAPHSEVDASLSVHIPLAVIWVVAVAAQLWSGGVGSRRRMHRIGGWIALACVLVGVSLSAGWVWTYLHDFVDGFTGGRARAGYYTIILGIGVAVNAVMLVVYARKKDFLAHKDCALMALFWTLDPGVHRFFMWIMRLFTWDWWAPEMTGGLGIALAKLPANLTLILWALAMAAYAGRLNRIILANVAGQFLLFLVSSFGLMGRTMSAAAAGAIVLTSLALGVVALVMARRAGVLMAASPRRASRPG